MAKTATAMKKEKKKPKSKVDFTPADALKAAGAGYSKEAKKIAAATKKAAMKKAAMKNQKAAMQKVALQKKPAGTGLQELQKWAEEDNDEHKPDDPEDFSSVPTKVQAHVFAAALAKPIGTPGSLPEEIHSLWKGIASGPGTIPLRHSVRNMIVPKDAKYGYMCRVDPNGPLMQRVRNVFEVKQRNQQMVGLSKSEMLLQWKGNKQGMQEAIDEGDIQVSDGFYYWKRDIHDHITGGKQTFVFGGGDPRDMTQQDFGHMMSLLNNAPWADWAAKPITQDERKAVADGETPGGELAMKKAEESLAALQAIVQQIKTLYKKCKDNNTMGGSIPTILKTSMEKVKELEEVHIAKLSDFIYGLDQQMNIKDVKQMLLAAAPATAEVNQSIKEITALSKSSSGAPKK